MSPNEKLISIRIPESLLRQIDSRATREDRSRAAMIRLLFDKALNGKRSTKK